MKTAEELFMLDELEIAQGIQERRDYSSPFYNEKIELRRKKARSAFETVMAKLSATEYLLKCERRKNYGISIKRK